MKRKYLLIAQIFEYVFCFIHFFIAALFYSMSNNLYWLFVCLGVVSISVGLYTETLKYRLENKTFGKRDKNILIIICCLSIIACPAIIFNVLGLLNQQEEITKEKVLKERIKKDSMASIIVTGVSFVLIFVLAFVAMMVETSVFQIKVEDKTLTKAETDIYNKGSENALNGVNYTIDDPSVSLSYTVYKPNDASATNPYPVIFVLPGFTRTKASMSQYAVEFTRRGAVVFVLDPGSQGATTYGGYEVDENGEYVLDANGNKIQNSYSVARSGMGYLVQYIYNNVEEFDYIDREKIGIVGHSAGGGDACKLASDFAGSSYDTSLIKALYVSGYIKTSAANVFYKLRCNTAMSYAKYDEGSFRYQDENQAYEIIALRFINEVNSKTNSANGKFAEFEEDREYGNFDNGTYRVIHHEDINHCFEMYDNLSIANTINFFRQSFDLDTTLNDTNQIWFVKEISTGLMLACAFSLVIGLVFVIVKYVPFMKSLEKAGNERLALEYSIREKYSSSYEVRAITSVKREEKTFLKRMLFYLPTILTAIIACLDFIPLARLSMDLFPDAAGNVYTYYFPERMMNAVFLWAIVNGAIGLIIWVLTTVLENVYYIIKAKITKTEFKADWSKFALLKVKPLDLLKSLAMAILLFIAFYGVLALVYLITHQDFRFMLISASPLNKRMFVTWLIYLGGFYVFYVSNSIRVNLTIAREGYKEWQVMIISALANSLGLVFIIVINYFVYFKTGTVFYGYYSPTDQSEMWLYVNIVFGLIPMMAILPIFNRILYKKTGNVYSGALLWCMIFIMMSLSASISFIPM